MGIVIALAGNPNCGKTTTFNELTGSNQFVGNWPGVTVEKKEGKLTFKKETISIWLKVIVAMIPGTIVTLLFDDYVESNFHTPIVIAIALIVYGIAFIVIENKNKKPGVIRNCRNYKLKE